MFGFGEMIKGLKANPKTIVFTEGTDARILEASARLLSGTFLKPILIGKEDEVFAAAEEAGFNIRGAEIVDPAVEVRPLLQCFCQFHTVLPFGVPGSRRGFHLL